MSYIRALRDLLGLNRPVASAFLQGQTFRAFTRLMLLRASLIVAGFWAVWLLLSAWMVAYGLGAVVVLSLAVWCILAAPAVFVQVMLILDLASYVLRRRVYMYPSFVATLAVRTELSKLARRTGRRERRTPWERLLDGAGNTSPFEPLAIWCFIILARIPALADVAIKISKRAQRSIARDLEKFQEQARSRRSPGFHRGVRVGPHEARERQPWESIHDPDRVSRLKDLLAHA